MTISGDCFLELDFAVNCDLISAAERYSRWPSVEVRGHHAADTIPFTYGAVMKRPENHPGVNLCSP